jgi:hypothetical protein
MRCSSSLVLIAAAVLQGCYTYVPLQTTTSPTVGERMVFHISDRGRVELGDRLGPGVTAIEGRVASNGSDVMSVSVIGVSYVSGERSTWSGETMRLDPGHVQFMRARRLDKGRTWLAAGAATVVVGAFIASRGLLGAFTGERDPGEVIPPQSLFPSIRFRF